MTKLQAGAPPLTRETANTMQRRAVVVELSAAYMVVRLKGTRQRFTLRYDSLYVLGAKQNSERVRAEKAAAKKLKAKK